MKIEEKEVGFSPTILEIKLESPAEVEALASLACRNISIPELFLGEQRSIIEEFLARLYGILSGNRDSCLRTYKPFPNV